jgi:hypothetical protein
MTETKSLPQVVRELAEQIVEVCESTCLACHERRTQAERALTTMALEALQRAEQELEGVRDYVDEGPHEVALAIRAKLASLASELKTQPAEEGTK